jgi:serine/threonine-protein kinase
MDIREQLQRSMGDAYTLERELGGGGMSRVFLAREKALGRQVVVKVLPPEMTAQVSVERFNREILLAARLQHPHIVPVLSAGESGGSPYFTMPFVEGESLRARLARRGELPVTEAIRLLREIASALAYAHERGIVHRDIKPDNVLVSGGSAMVTDFGVAKALSASSNAESSGMTSLGVALGTPAYMAPEQASADPNVDHRADIYAFGVLAYELLTGQPPFVGRTPQNLLAAHVTEAPELISKRRASLPPALAGLVMRCLEKRPADRVQSAAEIVHALDDITTPSGGMQPTSATPAFGSGGAAVTASGGAGNRTPLKIAAGVIVVVLVAAGIWRFSANRSASPGTGAPEAVRSIAVLPFTSADTASEYFAVGISDAVRSELTQDVRAVRVMSRSSSLSFRGHTIDAIDAGKKLGVSAVLGGDIRSSGTHIHITAELVNVADGSALWSGTFDREAKDVFALQDSIAHAVAGTLQAQLADAHRAGETNAGTSNLKAYDLFLRARFFQDQRGARPLRRAIDLYQQAIALDPKFARAYSGLGTSLIVLPGYSSVSVDSVYAPAVAAIDRALELDPTLVEAYGARGNVLEGTYQWNDADAAFRRAIQLDPQFGMAYMWLCNNLVSEARFTEGEAACRRATELEPLQAVTWSNYGFALWLSGKDTEAHAAFGRALEITPGFVSAIEQGAVAYSVSGKPALALAEILKQPESGLSASSLGTRAYIFARSGRRADAETIVKGLEREAGGGAYFSAISYANIGLGNLDAAVDYFVRSARTHDAAPPSGPDFDPIRSHPRYPELLRALNVQDQPIAKLKAGVAH